MPYPFSRHARARSILSTKLSPCAGQSQGGGNCDHSLPDSRRDFLEGQVASKDYGNVREYFRTLLREAGTKELLLVDNRG